MPPMDMIRRMAGGDWPATAVKRIHEAAALGKTLSESGGERATRPDLDRLIAEERDAAPRRLTATATEAARPDLGAQADDIHRRHVMAPS